MGTALFKSNLDEYLLLNNGDLDVNAGLDANGSDFLHGLQGGGQVDDALVDAHFEAVPGLGTLTARSLAGGDAEDLGGHASRAAGLDLLLGSLSNQIAAGC